MSVFGKINRYHLNKLLNYTFRAEFLLHHIVFSTYLLGGGNCDILQLPKTLSINKSKTFLHRTIGGTQSTFGGRRKKKLSYLFHLKFRKRPNAISAVTLTRQLGKLWKYCSPCTDNVPQPRDILM